MQSEISDTHKHLFQSACHFSNWHEHSIAAIYTMEIFIIIIITKSIETYYIQLANISLYSRNGRCKCMGMIYLDK